MTRDECVFELMLLGYTVSKVKPMYNAWIFMKRRVVELPLVITGRSCMYNTTSNESPAINSFQQLIDKLIKGIDNEQAIN